MVKSLCEKRNESITPNRNGDRRVDVWKKAWKEVWSWRWKLRFRAP